MVFKTEEGKNWSLFKFSRKSKTVLDLLSDFNLTSL